LSSLSKAWNTLIKHIGNDLYCTRLAIFVDGLDEFEGLDADMARLFGAAADSVNVKVCASSRPHVVYENSFANRPSLRLQDLTYNDIRSYVEDRLVRDESMQDLSAREPVQTPKLVEEIVTAADGVFLWVQLVVTALLRGLGNCDEIADLRRKLRLLPKDLKDLYTHMILKVDEDYKEEAVNFFQLVNATQPLDDDSRQVKPLTILSLCLAKEPLEELPTTVKALQTSPEEMYRRCRDMSRRLKTRSGGLLEVQLRGAKPNNISPVMKIGYLHRTVREFVSTKEMIDILQAETDFDPNYAMLKASVFELQVQSQENDTQPLWLSALTYAWRAQSRSQRPPLSQVYLLDQLYMKTPRKYLDKSRAPVFREANTFQHFIYTAVEWDLHCYIREKLIANNRFPTSIVKRELLHLSLGNERVMDGRTILTLLTCGVDPFILEIGWQNPAPNAKPGESMSRERVTIFQKVLQHLDRCGSVESNEALFAWADVLKYLLRPDKESQITVIPSTAYDVVARVFARLPDINVELQQLLAQVALEIAEASRSSGKSCCIQ
jgi:hypothetical protein